MQHNPILSIHADWQNKIAAGGQLKHSPFKAAHQFVYWISGCPDVSLQSSTGRSNPHPSPAMMLTCVEKWNSWRHKYGPADVKSGVQTKWQRNNKMTTGNCRWRCERFATKYTSTRSRLPIREGGVTLSPWMSEFSNDWTDFGKNQLAWANRIPSQFFSIAEQYENSRCYSQAESVSNLAWTSWRKSVARSKSCLGILASIRTPKDYYMRFISNSRAWIKQKLWRHQNDSFCFKILTKKNHLVSRRCFSSWLANLQVYIM